MGLCIEKLVVELGGNEILHSVNLEIENGELFSLLGPSGCGKTTLLKTVAGLIIQTGGSISFNGQSLDGLPPEKRDLAVVFQELRLFPNMNVAENVAFPLKMRGIKKKERLQKASEVLAQVQLEGFDKRRVSQLSGGQQQRVALARAIIANPRVLLLDEPFSSLDENLRDDMRDLLTMLHSQLDTMMVLVTHDQNEALKLSDRIAIMDSGHILQCDKPYVIYSQPANLMIARYFSDFNIVEGSCSGGTFTCPLFSCECDLPDGAATAMIRMPAISLADEQTGQPYDIIRADYLGDREKLVVSRLGIELELDVDYRGDLVEGATVYLRIDPEKVLIFPDEGTAGIAKPEQ